ncbi:unnamed protein product, partial [Owenia fusiformis]
DPNRTKMVILSAVWLMLFGQCLCMTIETNVRSQTDYLNMCMDNTKASPSPEPGLEGSMCPTFANRSCCKPGPLLELLRNYTLSYAHCPQKKSLGATCYEKFIEEGCFFTCSPDLGPWINREHPNFGEKNSLRRLPICQSTCERWYNACQKEYTCSNDWFLGLNISTQDGQMKCLDESKCDKYDKHFDSANSFCEQIWDDAYKVVSDDEPCMQFTYDTSGAERNKAVAEARAKELASTDGSSAGSPNNSVSLMLTSLVAYSVVFVLTV